jgi:hypothetical protein
MFEASMRRIFLLLPALLRGKCCHFFNRDVISWADGVNPSHLY